MKIGRLEIQIINGFSMWKYGSRNIEWFKIQTGGFRILWFTLFNFTLLLIWCYK